MKLFFKIIYLILIISQGGKVLAGARGRVRAHSLPVVASLAFQESLVQYKFTELFKRIHERISQDTEHVDWKEKNWGELNYNFEDEKKFTRFITIKYFKLTLENLQFPFLFSPEKLQAITFLSQHLSRNKTKEFLTISDKKTKYTFYIKQISGQRKRKIFLAVDEGKEEYDLSFLVNLHIHMNQETLLKLSDQVDKMLELLENNQLVR